ncbi:MAG: hypothetical protein AAB393_00885, partial [Bacteroidota bacterium]
MSSKLNVLLDGVQVSGGTMHGILNFSDIGEEYPPAGAGIRVTDEFILSRWNSSVNFTNGTLTYNYTPYRYNIYSEEKLRLFKCEDYSNCNWTQLNITVDQNANLLSWNITDFSVFLLGEDYTPDYIFVPHAVVMKKLVEVPVNVPYPVNVPVNVIASVSLDIPASTKMLTKSEQKLVLTLSNTGSVDLEDLDIAAESSDPNIKVFVTPSSLPKLAIDENRNVEVTVTSGKYEGNYSIQLKASSAKTPVEGFTTLRVEAYRQETLDMRRALDAYRVAETYFTENPECSEFGSLLGQAKEDIKEERYL